jgi:hypothetical protein
VETTAVLPPLRSPPCGTAKLLGGEQRGPDPGDRPEAKDGFDGQAQQHLRRHLARQRRRQGTGWRDNLPPIATACGYEHLRSAAISTGDLGCSPTKHGFDRSGRRLLKGQGAPADGDPVCKHNFAAQPVGIDWIQNHSKFYWYISSFLFVLALLAPGRPEGRGPPDGRKAVRSTVGVRCATVALKKKSRKKPVATSDHIACNMMKEIRNIQKQHPQHSKNNTRKHQTSRSTLQHYNMEKIMTQHDEGNSQHSQH